MTGTAAVVAAYVAAIVLFGVWAGIMVRRSERRARELSELEEL
jgi:hypothetical protein